MAAATARGSEIAIPNMVARNAISNVCVIPSTAGLHIQSVCNSHGGYAHDALLVKIEKSGGQASPAITTRFEAASPKRERLTSKWNIASTANMASMMAVRRMGRLTTNWTNRGVSLIIHHPYTVEVKKPLPVRPHSEG